MTTERKSFAFLPRRGIMAEAEYPGIVKLVSRLVWECRGAIRNRAGRNAAKSCDTCVYGTFSDYRKRHKSGFDHINDHRQKKTLFLPLAVVSWQKSEYPGIAKLVSRLVWDQETVRSSRTTRTKTPLKSLITEGFIYSLSIAAQEVIENTLFFLFDLLCSDKCALTSRHTSDILHIE